MNIIQKNNKGPTCEHSGRDEEPVCTLLREWDSRARGACEGYKSIRDGFLIISNIFR